MNSRFHSAIATACAALAVAATASAAITDDSVTQTIFTESTGAQYIDTGIAPAFGLKFETTFRWMEPEASGTDNSLIGARTPNTNDRFFPIHNTEGVVLVGAGAGGVRYPVAGSPTELTDYDGAKKQGRGVRIARGQRYSVVADIATGTQTLTRDGALIYSGTLYNDFTFPSCNLYLFACNFNGTAMQQSKVQLYSFRIWRNGSLVRDYIPCVKDGVAGFWEDRSQQFVGSASSTAFLAGPRGVVGEPDYLAQWIASNGSTYLDTGVDASFDFAAEGKLRFTAIDTTKEATFLGAMNTYDPRRYLMPVHLVGNKLWFAAGNGNEYGQDKAKHYAGDPDNTGSGRISVTAGDDHTFAVTFADGNQSFAWDGATLYTSTVSDPASVGSHLYLFAACQNGTTNYFSSARCYYLKLWRDGELVRDFVPAIKDGEGCLYDTIGGECLFAAAPLTAAAGLVGPPAGTPTKPRYHLAYIGSTGAQYVNTGIEGRPGTKVEASLSWIDAQPDAIVLGSRKDGGNTRFFPLYANSYMFGYGAGVLGYYNTADVSYHRYSDGANTPSIANGTTYAIVADFGTATNQITLDGVLCYRDATAAVATGYPMYLFAANIYGTANYFSKARIRSLKIWQDGALVRDFIPVLADNGAPYLYDRHNDKFYQGAEAGLWDVGAVGDRYATGTVITIR